MQVLLPDIIFLNHYKGIADNTHTAQVSDAAEGSFAIPKEETKRITN